MEINENVKKELDNLISEIKTDWKEFFLEEYQQNELKGIFDIISLYEKSYKDIYQIFPPKNLIFNAFNHFNIASTKVVILGQDPYINPDEAMGLSFSCNTKIPPSLRNMYKELGTDLGVDCSSKTGDLSGWANQGVLLLNTALTVLQGKSNSHSKIWRKFTDNIIKMLSERCDNVCFVLWGTNAKSKEKFIDQDKHFIVKGVHPSPLSANRGFFGSKPFSRINEYLRSVGKDEIKW